MKFIVYIIAATVLALMLTLTLVMLFTDSRGNGNGCSEGLGRQACIPTQYP